MIIMCQSADLFTLQTEFKLLLLNILIYLVNIRAIGMSNIFVRTLVVGIISTPLKAVSEVSFSNQMFQMQEGNKYTHLSLICSFWKIGSKSKIKMIHCEMKALFA